MASTTSGVTYSPAALDPWPIETELAKSAYNQPQQQTLMDQYWLERQAAKNLYGEEVQANRDLQQQQMQNALKQKLIEQLQHAGQTPGVVEGMQAYGAGLPTEAYNALRAAAIARAGSENLGHLGSAASGFSGAGMTPEALTTNLGVSGFGVRPDIQIAGIHEAGANARAAATAAKEKDIIIPVGGTETGAIDPVTGLQVKTSLRLKPGTPDAEVQRRVADARRMTGLAQLQGSGVPGVTPGQLGTTIGTPTTRLGPASAPKTSAPPAPSGGGGVAELKVDASKAAQDRARAGMRILPPEVQQHYTQTVIPKLGNNVPVANVGGQLRYIIRGANGQPQVGPAVP